MRAPRLLFVGNFLIRHWGNGRTGIDLRLVAGALRNGWQVHTFSERDIARFLAPLGFMRNIGARMMNARLVKTARNWKPDVVFMSHCDYVANETLDRIHAAVPGVKIVHINCDPVETAHCRAQIARRMDSCDAVFVTTAGEVLKTWKTARNVVGFFPNPSDPSYEVEDNAAKTDFAYDLFFAGRPALADARRALLDASSSGTSSSATGETGVRASTCASSRGRCGTAGRSTRSPNATSRASSRRSASCGTSARG